MKTITLALSLAAMNAFAAVPEIQCQLDATYRSRDAYAHVPGTPQKIPLDKALVIKNGDFVLNAEIRQVCASNGKRCIDKYELITSLSNGESTAGSSIYTPFNRHPLSLSVRGTDFGSATCDVKAQ